MNITTVAQIHIAKGNGHDLNNHPNRVSPGKEEPYHGPDEDRKYHKWERNKQVFSLVGNLCKKISG